MPCRPPTSTTSPPAATASSTPGPATTSPPAWARPSAGLVAPALAYYDLAPWLAISSGPPSVVTAGQPFDMTVEVENSDGSLDAELRRLGDDPPGERPRRRRAGRHADRAGHRGLRHLHRADAHARRRRATRSSPFPATARPSATTAPFAVAPAAPRSSWSSAPRRPSSGSVGLTVAVLDGYGNLVTSFAGGVTSAGASRPCAGRPRPAMPDPSRWPAAASPPSPG